ATYAIVAPSLHDALPISLIDSLFAVMAQAKSAAALPDPSMRCSSANGSLGRLCEGLLLTRRAELGAQVGDVQRAEGLLSRTVAEDRKSTRLNSSHVKSSY